MINAETIDVACAIDMSGSIGLDDARAFLSEIKGMMDQYDSYRINLWSYDTKVYNHVVITQDNAEDLLTYVPKGGGGTSYEVNYEFMRDSDINPKQFINFTDGYPNSGWGEPEFCETLFIIKGNTKAVAPFGQTVIYEKL